MSAAAVEELLARLYTDATLRQRFMAAPQEVARRAGLDADEVLAMAAVDHAGLVLAARSYAHKRAGRGGKRRAGLVAALLQRFPLPRFFRRGLGSTRG